MRKLFREKDAIHIVEPAPTISPVRQTIASTPDAAVERAQIAADRIYVLANDDYRAHTFPGGIGSDKS
jgi:hypothetical protein